MGYKKTSRLKKSLTTNATEAHSLYRKNLSGDIPFKACDVDQDREHEERPSEKVRRKETRFL